MHVLQLQYSTLLAHLKAVKKTDRMHDHVEVQLPFVTISTAGAGRSYKGVIPVGVCTFCHHHCWVKRDRFAAEVRPNIKVVLQAGGKGLLGPDQACAYERAGVDERVVGDGRAFWNDALRFRDLFEADLVEGPAARLLAHVVVHLFRP